MMRGSGEVRASSRPAVAGRKHHANEWQGLGKHAPRPRGVVLAGRAKLRRQPNHQHASLPAVAMRERKME